MASLSSFSLTETLTFPLFVSPKGLQCIVSDYSVASTLWQLGCFGQNQSSKGPPKRMTVEHRKRQSGSTLVPVDIEAAMSHLLIPNAETEPETNFDPSAHSLADHALSELYLLSSEELFYLWHTFPDSIVLEYEKKRMDRDPVQLLHFFSLNDPDFNTRYAVYAHYRSQGYVVKSGLKYGTHYLLYRGGAPGQVHSEFAVYIQAIDRPDLNWHHLVGLCRTCDSVKKTLLMAIVKQDSNVMEIEASRWNPKTEREK